MPGRFVLALILTLVTSAAQAQFRTIPPEAKRATLDRIQGSVATINGKNLQLAVGAQIRDGHNMIVVPMAVPPNLLIKFLLDGQGQVYRVWILSPAEASQPDPK